MTFKELLEKATQIQPFHYVVPTNMDKLTKYMDSLIAAQQVDPDNNKVSIRGDWDVDGALAAKGTANAFDVFGLDYEVDFGTKKVHGITQDYVNHCIVNNIKHVIIVDSSSDSMELITHLTSLGIRVVVIDHHQCKYQYEDYPDNCIIINSVMKGNEEIKAISAGFLVYLVWALYKGHRGLRPKESDFILGYITLISDSCELSDEYIKPIIIAAPDLKQIPSEVELFMTQWDKLNRTFLEYKFNNKINTTFRLGRIDLIMKLFFDKDNRKKLEACNEIKELHDKTKEELLKLLPKALEFTEDLPNCNYLDMTKLLPFTNLTVDYLVSSTGLLAAKISDATGKPVITYMKNDLDYKASGRDVKNQFPFYTMIKSLDIDGGGHKGAIGFNLSALDIDRVKHYTSTLDITIKETLPYLILPVKSPTPTKLKELYRKVAVYNEIAGKALTPIRLEIYLDPLKFSSIVKDKIIIFTMGDVAVKDLQKKSGLGDSVLVSPVYKKPTEGLIQYT